MSDQSSKIYKQNKKFKNHLHVLAMYMILKAVVFTLNNHTPYYIDITVDL